MGQEILYCYKCQTRLLGSEFEKGKAFKVGDKATCAECAKELFGSLPEVPKSDTPPKISSSYRLSPIASDSPAKAKPATARAGSPAPKKSANGLIIGGIVGVIVLLLLVAMAMNSGSGPTVRREPAPPAPKPIPPVVRTPDPAPVPVPPATPSFTAEIREIDDKLRTGLAKEEFRSLMDYLTEARKRRPEGEWLNDI